MKCFIRDLQCRSIGRNIGNPFLRGSSSCGCGWQNDQETRGELRYTHSNLLNGGCWAAGGAAQKGPGGARAPQAAAYKQRLKEMHTDGGSKYNSGLSFNCNVFMMHPKPENGRASSLWHAHHE